MNEEEFRAKILAEEVKKKWDWLQRVSVGSIPEGSSVMLDEVEKIQKLLKEEV